jgi:hypothetical protein
VNRPPKTKKELDACITNLKFDPQDLAGDEQRLLIIDSRGSPCPGNTSRRCRHGPRAKIEPLVNAHKLSIDQLRQGRIIAQLTITDGQEGYPKLNLATGHKTYWWVKRDASRSGGESVFISDSVTVGDRLWTSASRKLEVTNVRAGTFTRALARWLWLEEDETAKGTCGSATCK